MTILPIRTAHLVSVGTPVFTFLGLLVAQLDPAKPELALNSEPDEDGSN